MDGRPQYRTHVCTRTPSARNWAHHRVRSLLHLNDSYVRVSTVVSDAASPAAVFKFVSVRMRVVAASLAHTAVGLIWVCKAAEESVCAQSFAAL